MLTWHSGTFLSKDAARLRQRPARLTRPATPSHPPAKWAAKPANTSPASDTSDDTTTTRKQKGIRESRCCSTFSHDTRPFSSIFRLFFVMTDYHLSNKRMQTAIRKFLIIYFHHHPTKNTKPCTICRFRILVSICLPQTTCAMKSGVRGTNWERDTHTCRERKREGVTAITDSCYVFAMFFFSSQGHERSFGSE